MSFGLRSGQLGCLDVTSPLGWPIPPRPPPTRRPHTVPTMQSSSRGRRPLSISERPAWDYSSTKTNRTQAIEYTRVKAKAGPSSFNRHEVHQNFYYETRPAIHEMSAGLTEQLTAVQKRGEAVVYPSRVQPLSARQPLKVLGQHVVEAAQQVDSAHKRAEALVAPSTRGTDLARELLSDFDAGTWTAPEHGGTIEDIRKAVAKFRAAHEDECRGLDEDDLIAARVYTREKPVKVYDALNSVCRNMLVPDVDGVRVTPEKHCAMYTHLHNAVDLLNGSGGLPLYRGQKKLYGSSPKFDPEDIRQFETDSIVTWKAFTSASTKQEKPREYATDRGVLFVIEPPHAYPDLGAQIPATEPPLSVYTGTDTEDEVLLPPGSTFRVVSVEYEGALRVITLKHMGTWVSDEVYALPDIAMSRRLSKLKVSRLAFNEAKLERETKMRQIVEDRRTAEDRSEEQLEGTITQLFWTMTEGQLPKDVEQMWRRPTVGKFAWSI
eukprot:COSAG02_NODE_7984_length_2757_cov_6.599699_1_plen_492_part_00